jgi:membrane protein DedA with SNARE-associated domain
MASLATMATGFVHRDGLAGIFLGMTMESAGVPVPSEVIMPLGALAFPGTRGLLEVIALGTLGNIVGSWVAYAIGAVLGVEWRGSRWLNRRHWEAAHTWFGRYGNRAVFFGRILPVVRTYISFPAGAASMPPGRFTAYTLAGSIIWTAVLALLGRLLGAHWHQIVNFFGGFTDVTVLAVVVAIVLLVLRARRRRAPGDGA